jgi:hypothetical protein
VKFWDASAIGPLCVAAPASPTVRDTVEDDPRLVVWWGTRTVCGSGGWVRTIFPEA